MFEFACCSTEDKIFKANIKKYSWDKDADNARAGTPLLLVKVCSVWRNVALSAPQLWTNVIIYYEDDRDEDQAAMLKYWLSKSGERPLDVHLMQQGPLMTTEHTEVIDVLVAYAHRFRTLNLFLPDEWERALKSVANRVPLLTHLTLRWPADEDEAIADRADMFANAPQLRKVKLVGYYGEQVKLPWAQLEKLESPFISPLDCVETLRLCSRLRRCKISDIRMGWTTLLPAPLTHTALEVLEVVVHPVETLSVLFAGLELPALRVFRLLLCCQWVYEWSSWLPSFLMRSGGMLSILYLPYASPLEEELLMTLQVVPGLRKLVLLNKYWYALEKRLTQKALDMLNPNKYKGLLEYEDVVRMDGQGGEGASSTNEISSTHCLLPNLEVFEYEGAIDFTPHALVEFLLARWTSPPSRSELEGQARRQIASEPAALKPSALLVTRLLSATFTTPYRIAFEDADIAVIKRLRHEGMRLEFRLQLLKDGSKGCQGHNPLYKIPYSDSEDSE